jgi:hypothetical protein
VHVSWLPKHLTLCHLCVPHPVIVLVLEIYVHNLAFLVCWLLILLLLMEIMLSNSKVLVVAVLVHVVGHALGHVPLSSIRLLSRHLGARWDPAVALGLQLLPSAQRIAMLRQRWRHRPLLEVGPAALPLFTRRLLRPRVAKPPAPQLPASHRTSRPHSLPHLHCIHRNRFSTPNRPHSVSTSSLVSLQIMRHRLLPKLRLHLPLQRRLASLFLLRIAVGPLHVHLGSSTFFPKRILVLILVLHFSLVLILLLMLLLKLVLLIFSLFVHSLFF